MATERWISTQSRSEEERRTHWSLRPTSLGEYVGQPDLIERIRIAVEAARQRGEAVGHVLLHGPPGLGKTTMAHVIASEMRANVHTTSGPALTRGSDLAGALTRLKAHDVLFIDEIHRLPAAVEEFIYPAMEDGRIDVSIDSGMSSRTMTISLEPFTLIGATTRTGLLSSPLLSRFELTHHLTFYSQADLLEILTRSCGLLEISSDDGALDTIAGRSRGTPRVANRLLKRVRDYAQVRSGGRIDPTTVAEALALEGVDERGLDQLDRAYLSVIAGTYRGGPVGLEALAATMGQDAGTLEDVVEPFLLQIGLVARTRRGRQLTTDGTAFVGRYVEMKNAADGALFDS